MIAKVLLLALIIVESHGDDNAINGNAVGCLQITPAVVKDVNRIAGTNFTLQDRFDRQKSIQMAEIYLKYYGEIYTKKTGKQPDNQTYARIWNGGPNGWQKTSTQDFWLKVKREIEKQQSEDRTQEEQRFTGAQVTSIKSEALNPKYETNSKCECSNIKNVSAI